MGASTERIPKDKTDFIKALAKADLAAKEQFKRQHFDKHTPSLAQMPPTTSESTPASEKKVFTFAEIEKVVKLADPLKILKALKDQKKETVFSSEAYKWHQAAELIRSYFKDFKESGVPQSYTPWLKTVLKTSDMIQSGLYEDVEANLQELHREWLNLKADAVVGNSQSEPADAGE